MATYPQRKIPMPTNRPPMPKQKKTFSVGTWNPNVGGEKIMIYGDTGMGKTTLAGMAPTPVFLGLDEGGRKIQINGQSLQRIEGLETFEDVRDVLRQINLFDKFNTVVIDTVTLLQDLAEKWMFTHVAGPKGAVIQNIESYGYNKGYKHLYDTMKLILQDCDALVHAGKNVILVAQSHSYRVSNPAGEDFLRDGPRLHVDKTWNIEALYCEWCDHILRIDYQNLWTKERKATGDTTRVIYTQPEVYYRAKSRTLTDAAISFENEKDSSVWQLLFGGK